MQPPPATALDGESERLDINRATSLTPEVAASIDDMFSYQPWSDIQTAQGTRVREALHGAAVAIIENVPPCPDRSAAMRKLREARMDANSAITHAGRY